MLSDELINFCKRWVDKADKYTNDTTEEVFDKFFSLYIPYNAIYFDATLELIENEKIGKKRNGDQVSATKNIPVYVGQDRLYRALQTMRSDIEQIVELIDNGTFYIITKRDNITPDTDKDNEYLSDIRNYHDTTTKAKQKKYNEAILSFIYGVRCNIFHGKKGFDPIQKQLLIPMNKILEMIIKELLLQNNGKGE